MKSLLTAVLAASFFVSVAQADQPNVSLTIVVDRAPYSGSNGSIQLEYPNGSTKTYNKHESVFLTPGKYSASASVNGNSCGKPTVFTVGASAAMQVVALGCKEN